MFIGNGKNLCQELNCQHNFGEKISIKEETKNDFYVTIKFITCSILDSIVSI